MLRRASLEKAVTVVLALDRTSPANRAFSNRLCTESTQGGVPVDPFLRQVAVLLSSLHAIPKNLALDIDGNVRANRLDYRSPALKCTKKMSSLRCPLIMLHPCQGGMETEFPPSSRSDERAFLFMGFCEIPGAAYLSSSVTPEDQGQPEVLKQRRLADQR